LITVFEPGFRVAGGRVTAGNWGFFSCRQIVREHGGDILIGSIEGQGSTLTVPLPKVKSADAVTRRPPFHEVDQPLHHAFKLNPLTRVAVD